MDSKRILSGPRVLITYASPCLSMDAFVIGNKWPPLKDLRTENSPRAPSQSSNDLSWSFRKTASSPGSVFGVINGSSLAIRAASPTTSVLFPSSNTINSSARTHPTIKSDGGPSVMVFGIIVLVF